MGKIEVANVRLAEMSPGSVSGNTAYAQHSTVGLRAASGPRTRLPLPLRSLPLDLRLRPPLLFRRGLRTPQLLLLAVQVPLAGHLGEP